MYQEFIYDFLKIPGVLGVALVKGQAIPYFYIKQTFEWHQKHTLIQSIRQSITKASSEVDFFEFQVMGYYAYIYKLNPSLRFLILTDTDIAKNKLRALAATQLKAVLQKDFDKTITAFKVLTENISQPKEIAKIDTELCTIKNSSSVPLEEVTVSIEEVLNALNLLSQFSSNYVGKKLTANYWQLTRPNFDWLDHFQINHSAEITFSGAITETVSVLQHQAVKEWVAAFIKKCSQIIQDLHIMIEQNGLDTKYKSLLLTAPG